LTPSRALRHCASRAEHRRGSRGEPSLAIRRTGCPALGRLLASTGIGVVQSIGERAPSSASPRASNRREIKKEREREGGRERERERGVEQEKKRKG